ncbi:T5E21.6 [Arabidopsis thaliana]|nr:T5E21.6 [Arabidopsis thaliana]
MGSSQGSTLSADVMSLVDTLPVLAKTLIAGGAAGAIAKTAVAPLERIKILLQLSSTTLLNSCDVHNSRRGNGASVIRIIPYAALHYMTYEVYRDWILEKNLPLGSGPIVDLVAGSAAGGTAVLCTYPLDLARTKLAYQVSDTRQSLRGGANGFYRQPTYSGIKEVLAMAYKEGGPRGLYRGIGPTLIGILPYAGLKFYIYEELKRHVPEEHQNSVRMHLPCGALAGLFGQTITYPLDVVRRQMQVENLQPMTSEGNNKRYKNTFDGLNTIVRTQGWKQLFAGLSINYIKIVPSVAIGFTVYESMKSWMRIPPRERSKPA